METRQPSNSPMKPTLHWPFFCPHVISIIAVVPVTSGGLFIYE